LARKKLEKKCRNKLYFITAKAPKGRPQHQEMRRLGFRNANLWAGMNDVEKRPEPNGVKRKREE
jgi:hypothetical protein